METNNVFYKNKDNTVRVTRYFCDYDGNYYYTLEKFKITKILCWERQRWHHEHTTKNRQLLDSWVDHYSLIMPDCDEC